MALNHLLAHRDALLRLQGEIQCRPAHAYLLLGSRGVGKTTAVRALALSLLCERAPGPGFCCNPVACPVAGKNTRPGTLPGRCDCCTGCAQVAARAHPDFHLVERLEGRTEVLIEQVRETIAALFRRPVRASLKVTIIDDAETLSPPAQQALLKVLEEPPGHAIVFVASRSEGALLETLRSRLRIVRLSRLTCDEVKGILLAKGVEPSRAATLATLSDGVVPSEWLSAEAEAVATSLLSALQRGAKLSYPEIRELVEGVFRERERAAEAFELLIRFLGRILEIKMAAGLSSTPASAIEAELRSAADALSAETVVEALERALRALEAIKGMASPSAQAELWWIALREMALHPVPRATC